MRREYLFIVIAAIFYGSAVAGGEVFLRKGLSLFEITLYPILLMTLVLLPVVVIRPGLMIRVSTIPFYIVYGLIGALAEFCQFAGLAFNMPVAVVALVLYSQPLWTVFLSSLLLREPITKRKLIAVALCFNGVVVLMIGFWTGGAPHPLKGFFASLLASVFLSLWIIWGRKSGLNKQHYVTTTFGWGASTSLWLILLLPPLSGMLNDPVVSRLSTDFPASYWIDIFLFAIAGGIISSFCFFQGLRLVDASVAGVILMLEPVSAALLAAVLFRQSLHVTTVAGGALILLSNYVIASEPRSEIRQAFHSVH